MPAGLSPGSLVLVVVTAAVVSTHSSRWQEDAKWCIMLGVHVAQGCEQRWAAVETAFQHPGVGRDRRVDPLPINSQSDPVLATVLWQVLQLQQQPPSQRFQRHQTVVQGWLPRVTLLSGALGL